MGEEDCFQSAGGAKRYAFVSHESAVDAICLLAQRKWEGVMDDEDVWAVPAANCCVKTQGDVVALAKEVDLEKLGIVRKPLDLLVPNKTCYSRGKLARFHVWRDYFPPHSFVRIHELVFVSTPYFVVVQLALARRANRLAKAEAQAEYDEDMRIRRDLGIEADGSSVHELVQWANVKRLARAAQVLCDFSGTYRHVSGSSEEVVYQTKPLVSLESFCKYLEQMKSAKGIMRARKAGEMAYDNAASPMETTLALMLTFPVEMGGFGLPRPVLNWEVSIDPLERDLASQDGIIADLCWAEQRVIVEYYGWKEHFGKGLAKVGEDASRANSLTVLGWTVFHVTYEQVKTVEGMSLLARQVAASLGVALQGPTDLQRVWRSKLLALLMPRSID